MCGVGGGVGATERLVKMTVFFSVCHLLSEVFGPRFLVSCFLRRKLDKTGGVQQIYHSSHKWEPHM